ncbi:DUF3834 domain-containing protein [Acidianus sp. HS-5]|uniref:DUF3834 domain-containing protein n=1 Tax=Acidianus sp. HS-5 TaxID=2886040 RepID=UPI001F1BB098|nr:DUF3834 domain-containing protein [Acidianus sp. HS-5]BDC18023.1 hypothetical protein HS5_09130 [Acidianus sp. HS-5]
MVTVLTPPGPVSYPIIASTMKRKDVKVVFEGDGEVKLNAIPLLERTDYVLVSRMLVITPSLGKRIAVWKKGSANHMLLDLVLKLYNHSAEVVFTDDPAEVYKLYKEGKVDSAVVTTAVSRDGLYFEDLLLAKDFNLPGICGAEGLNEDFESAYKEGIDLFKEDPEGTSEYVADNLPIYRPSLFIQSIFENSEFKVQRLEKPYVFRKA